MRPRCPVFALCLAALCLTAACAPGAITPSPAPGAAPPAAAAQLPDATRDLHAIPSPTPEPALPPEPSASPAPSLPPASLAPTRAPTATVLSWLAQRDPYLLQVPAAEPGDEVIGLSSEGHALIARRIGTGERVLLLVGGMHGGWEQNTIALAERLADHFAQTPADVPAGWSIVVVPAANPDGVLLGRQPEGRLNGRGVDLNRNWGCDWEPQAVWRETPVSPGTAPFSEPETRALAGFITRLQPDAAIFFHSQAGGVYAGDCPTGPGAPSGEMSAVYGEASGYNYGETFNAYPVTGTAASWAHGQGIPAADVELRTSNLAEMDDNLRGVLAVMAWIERRAGSSE